MITHAPAVFREDDVLIRVPRHVDVALKGTLTVPPSAHGLVLFAHGSGSGRRSTRNRMVANSLQSRGLATLLFDLLSVEEAARDEVTLELRFDIPFLAERLRLATAWVRRQSQLNHLPIGYFGASTGAAAALVAAAEESGIGAVVSRGGRPDLAGKALPKIGCATLFIVGSNDDGVIELNEKAYDRLNCVKQLTIVPGATHLFEEPGTLDEVADLAGRWFSEYLHSTERS